MAGAAALVASGCHGKSNEGSTPPPAAAAALAPVPAPPGLLAKAKMPTPEASWQKVQRGVGGTFGILPSTLGGMMCAVAGLDAGLGPEIDGGAAAYAVFAGAPTAPSWAIAARLVEERKARALYEGEAARFDVQPAGEGISLLVPKGRTLGRGPVAAIAQGGWFVLARSADDLAALAPYATRTLPVASPADGTRDEAISIDVPKEALAGPIAAALAQSWSAAENQMLADDRALRDQHGGRAPDFGDPRAIVKSLDDSIQKKLAVLGDLAGVHVGVLVGDDDVRAVIAGDPASIAGAAASLASSFAPGDLAPVLALRRDVAGVLFERQDRAGRTADSARFEASLASALGARLTPPDEKRLHTAIDDWTKSRGDWSTLAVLAGADGRGLVGDFASLDTALTGRALHEALDAAAHVKGLHDPLEHWLHVRDVRFGSGDLPSGARATTAKVLTDAPPGYTVAWTAGTSDVQVALAEAPLPLLAPPAAGGTLGDDPVMRTLLTPLGLVGGLLFAQPGRLPGCAGLGGGVAFAWGIRSGESSRGTAALWGQLAASDPAVRCLAKVAF
jgi:hypothetical protein